MEYIALAVGILLTLACGGGLWVLLHNPRKEPASIPLEILSKLWLSEEQGETNQIKDLLSKAIGKTLSKPPEATVDKPPEKTEPDSEEPQKPTRFNVPEWKHSETKAFYEEFIAPCEGVIGQKALKTIVEILRLLDQEGSCPSVVSDESWSDEEANIYSALEKVSLRDHSFNTARNMLEILRREYSDFEMVIGKGLIAALGHDLGKIPRLRRAFYSTGDHPINSAMVVSNLAKDLPYREELVKAVRSHHETTNDLFTLLLKEADRRAREEEIAESKLLCTSETQEESEPAEPPRSSEAENNESAPPDPTDLSWLDLDDLLSRIEPYINRYVDRSGNILDETPPTGEIWWAFSMKDGLVYVMPSLISRIVGQIAREKGLSPFAYSLARDKEFQRKVEKAVASRLIEKGYIPDLIHEGYSGARFVVSFSGKKKDMVGFYLPVRAEAFGIGVGKLEARKEGVLMGIQKVRPRWS